MISEIDIDEDADQTCEHLIREQQYLLNIIADLVRADCGINGEVLAFRHRPTIFKAVKLLANHGRLTILELKTDRIRGRWTRKTS